MENKTCPYCGAELLPIEMPEESTWGGEIHHVCFNDECEYYTASWPHMKRSGAESTGYRFAITPRGGCCPVLVWSPVALKNRIVTSDRSLRESEKVYLHKTGYFLPEDMGGL